MKIVVSKGLKRSCFGLYQQWVQQLTNHGTEVVFGGSPTNIWTRDYLPVRGIRFQYKTVGYETYKQMLVCEKDFKSLAFRNSDLVVDGGNLVFGDNVVVATSMLFSWNKTKKPLEIVRQIESYFEKKLVIIPPEPGDTLGHSDGVLNFFNKDVAFVSDYENTPYKKEVCSILTRAGIECVLFPCPYSKCPQLSQTEYRKIYLWGDDYNPGIGYYVNFLKVDNLYLLPTFGFEEDDVAEMTIKHNDRNAIVKRIDCYDLAMNGGLLHCVTSEQA